MNQRIIKLSRKTKETEISIELNADQQGVIDIDTGLPFFDHMLAAMAFHGGFSITAKCRGDIEADPHHLVEDTGLVLGDIFRKLSTETGSVKRFAHAVIPMDEALTEVTIDVCGRPTLAAELDFPQNLIGTFDTCVVGEFLKALTSRARMSLHIDLRRGENSHHMAESLFKALGKALAEAYERDEKIRSTKGTLVD